jgi:uncharacterized protein DUF3618
MSDATSEPDRIERDLEHTRARMDSHLNALENRLSPGQILDDLMAYFRGSEGADFGRNLMDSVRSNPLPAALTGIGLTWLMASNPRPQTLAGDNRRVRVYRTSDGRAWSSREDLDRHFADIERSVTRRIDENDEIYHSRLDEARGKTLGVMRQAGDTAESFRQRVQDAWNAAKDTVAEGAYQLREKAGDAADQVAGYAQSTRERVAGGSQRAQQMGGNTIAAVADNPVLLGSFGLAMGALLGVLIPQSAKEEEALSGMATNARHAARDAAQQAVDRGGDIARAAMDTARDSAREHGLTSDRTVGEVARDAVSGDLAASAKQVAQDALKTAHQGLREGQKQEPDAAARASPAGTGSPTL